MMIWRIIGFGIAAMEENSGAAQKHVPPGFPVGLGAAWRPARRRPGASVHNGAAAGTQVVDGGVTVGRGAPATTTATAHDTAHAAVATSVAYHDDVSVVGVRSHGGGVGISWGLWVDDMVITAAATVVGTGIGIVS